MVRDNMYCFILLSFLFQIIVTEGPIIANVYYSSITGKYKFIQSTSIDPNAVASATYYKDYEKEGWDKLQISSYQGTDNKYKDYVKSYAMGYLEGILTYERIYSYYTNLLHFNDAIHGNNYSFF